MSIEATLSERGSRYGKFADQAVIEQELLAIIRSKPGWQNLDPDMRSALEMMQVKIARILNGDPAYHDNWHDITGYSKLIADRLAA